jgi:agmatine deiminase
MKRVNRRIFNKGLAAAALAGTGSAGAAASFQMPPEWAAHERCVMAYCAAWKTFDKGDVEDTRVEQAQIAKAIARFEPVTVLANPEDAAEAGKLCGSSVTVLEMLHYDVWARDTLPTIVKAADGARRAIGWNFNAWGGKFDGQYADDLGLAERFAKGSGVPFENAGLVMEGGGIETDGAGLLITTETAILNPNRNPGMTKAEAEAEWKRLLGVSKVVWLHGSDVDHVTDGHVDGAVKFLAPGHLVAEHTDDTEDPEHHELEDNLARLKGLAGADGGPINVHRLLRPRYGRIGKRGDDFAGSYVNCYIANKGVVLPRFGDKERDEAARALFEKLSGRPAVSVSIDTIAEGGGGIHCNTQQMTL